MSLLLSGMFLVVGWILPSWTAFTYQGKLTDGGNPTNGMYDLQFTLYVWTNTSPTVCAGPIVNSAVAVTNGLFTTTLDFGSSVFNGNLLLLEIGVRTNGSTNAFIVLSPRQMLTPAPYAIFANTASNLSGSLPATQLAGTLPASAFAGYTNTVALTNNGNMFSGTFNGTFIGNGGGVFNVNVANLTGILADSQLPSNTAFVNSNQTFSGANTFTGTNFFSGANNFTNWGNSFIGSFFGNGLVGWIPTNGTAVQADIDHGYLLTNTQIVTVTLPPSPNVGDIVRISGAGASGWQVALNTGQSVIGNFSSFAKSSWTPGGASTTLSWHSIGSSSDGSHLVAVASGSGGGIFTSINSGLTWSGPYGTSGAFWNAVASSADGTKLPAAVYGGGIFTNSGTAWTLVGGTSPANWISIASSADGTKLPAAVYGGGIYTNSGTAWTLVGGTSPANWISIASSADGTKLVAVVSGGGIYISINSGGSWAQSYGTPASGNWACVASSADGTRLVAVANGGGIYTWSNSGGTWTRQTNAPNANWTSVASSSDGSKLAAVINGGGIYTSSNFGVTWAQQSYAPAKNWSSIASSADGTKLAAAVNSTSSGGIYVSQASSQITTTTVGTNGYITGGQGTAVELQYVGNGLFMPVSSAGIIWAF
ncbi:MAG: hypothetical protein ABSD57_02830 [Verrucomicrobiota bacterium]